MADLNTSHYQCKSERKNFRSVRLRDRTIQESFRFFFLGLLSCSCNFISRLFVRRCIVVLVVVVRDSYREFVRRGNAANFTTILSLPREQAKAAKSLYLLSAWLQRAGRRRSTLLSHCCVLSSFLSLSLILLRRFFFCLLPASSSGYGSALLFASMGNTSDVYFMMAIALCVPLKRNEIFQRFTLTRSLGFWNGSFAKLSRRKTDQGESHRPRNRHEFHGDSCADYSNIEIGLYLVWLWYSVALLLLRGEWEEESCSGSLNREFPRALTVLCNLPPRDTSFITFNESNNTFRGMRFSRDAAWPLQIRFMFGSLLLLCSSKLVTNVNNIRRLALTVEISFWFVNSMCSRFKLVWKIRCRKNLRGFQLGK